MDSQWAHPTKAIAAGELEMNATVAGHFDSCLGCFACVSACPLACVRPADQPPGRSQSARLRTPWQTSFRKLLLAVLPIPGDCVPCSPPCVPTPAHHCRSWPAAAVSGCSAPAGAMEAAAALAPEGFMIASPREPPSGARRGRGWCSAACSAVLPRGEAATVVLQANGWVVIPKEQGCCGAASHHQGQWCKPGS